jgi:hypothetical protein
MPVSAPVEWFCMAHLLGGLLTESVFNIEALWQQALTKSKLV